MKNKIFNVFTIFAVIFSVCIIVYGAFEIKKLKDPNSIEHFIAVYENEPSNRNLIGLCNKLSIEKDKRLFKYFDDFMNMENFNGEIKKYENGNITDAEIDFCHDFMITCAFKTCAKNNDIDLLAGIMQKYYPQIRDKDKLFYLALANDGSAEATAFFKANAEKLVEVLEKFYTEADNPKLKLRYLIEISSYYRCDEVNNFELYKEKHNDEMAQLIDQCVSDSEFEKVAVLSAYFKSYWEHLLTGEENEGWNSALNETLSKYEEASNILDVPSTSQKNVQTENSKFTLTVNGKDILTNDLSINYEKKYAEIPMIATLKALDCEVEWVNNKKVKIIYDDIVYILNPSQKTLKKEGILQIFYW